MNQKPSNEVRRVVAQTKEEIKAKNRLRQAARRKTQAYQDWLVASRESRLALKVKYRREAETGFKLRKTRHDGHVAAWWAWKKFREDQKESARLFFLGLGWKLCKKCNMLHSIDCFKTKNDMADGLLPFCKKCHSKKEHERIKKNPIELLSNRIRSRIRSILREKGYPKRSRTHEILGCDFDTFIKHIERQFTDGMTWDKVGPDIHIDHIIPLATATTEQEVLALNHYTNLRPLWAAQNLSKGANVEFLI